MKNRILFEKPKHIDEVMRDFNLHKVSFVTTPNEYPMIRGIETTDLQGSVIRKVTHRIRRNPMMDAKINSYRNKLQKAWNKARRELNDLVAKYKKLNKVDYNNALTIDRIAKVPHQYKTQFVETANKYDMNLSLVDSIVVNPSLLVNARYDNKKNLIEVNPDYLKQHGMIRIGDSGEWISETAKTFTHEFGHVTWYNSLTEEDRRYWESLSHFLQRKELTGDMTQFIVGEKKRFDGSVMYSPYYTIRTDPFVSVYARFNTREDFAECFLYYKVAPKSLERIDPKKYAFMDAKVGQRIEKEIKKSFSVSPDDTTNIKKRKDKIIWNLKLWLMAEASPAFADAYLFGKLKAEKEARETAYRKSKAVNKITSDEKEKYVKPIEDKNAGFLDNFMQDISDDFDDVLFTKNDSGFVTGVKQYDDVDEFDESYNDVMDTKEHRLGVYATNGISAALIGGMLFQSREEEVEVPELEMEEPVKPIRETGQSDDEFKTKIDDYETSMQEYKVAVKEHEGEAVGLMGGYWHTHEDDRVCDGCNTLDGQWMTFDEFQELYGDNECDGNCRCAELFEPAPPPEGGDELELMVHSRMRKNEQNAYANTGATGSTIKETNLNRFANHPQKIVAVDYHGTIFDSEGRIITSMRNKMNEFKSRGFHIIIYTAGINKNPGQLNGIEVKLRENNVPFDEVWQRVGKPDADVYIDDKSFNPKTDSIENLQVTPEGNIKNKEA